MRRLLNFNYNWLSVYIVVIDAYYGITELVELNIRLVSAVVGTRAVRHIYVTTVGCGEAIEHHSSVDVL